MDPPALELLGLIGFLVGYRLLDRRLDERPSGLLTVAVAVSGALALRAFGSGPLDVEVVLSLALLALLGAGQVVGATFRCRRGRSVRWHWPSQSGRSRWG